MILRKPYAFFIKYFRLLNLAMALLMGIIAYRTFVIGKLLTNYVSDYNIIDSEFSIGSYLNMYHFLLILLIIVLTISVLSVLFVKKKPKKLYIINLAIYCVLVVVYSIDYSIIHGAMENILDIRVSKGLRDVTFIMFAVQLVSCLLTLVRATGFDIKNFDFQSDLNKLDVSSNDDEEFEVALELDQNKTRREVRKKIRNVKYLYFEHKLLVNTCLIILGVVIVFTVFINYSIYNSNYSQGHTFQASGVSGSVTNSYIVETDQDGNSLGQTLVVVKLNIKKVAETETVLNTGLTTLRVGGRSYGQTVSYNDVVSDLGTVYIGQELEQDFTNYLLVFNIPSTLKYRTMRLKINDNVSYVRGEMGAKNIYIKLEPQDLTEEVETQEINFGEEVNFNGSILGDTMFRISKLSVSNKFKVSYNFCSKKNKCTTSYEYVTPTASGNYIKTLMRIEGSYELDTSMNLDGLENMYYFLNEFATLHYELNGNWYTQKINSNIIKPSKAKENGVTYIEVNKNVEKAVSMYLSFKVRNYSYKYNLK